MRTNEVCSSSNPVFELEAGDDDDLINVIGFRNNSTGEIIYSGQLGIFPRCDQTNTNHTLFFCEESDTGQVCSFRPDFDALQTGVAVHLFNTGTREILNGACSALSTSVGDSFGSVVTASSAVTVNLEASGGNGAFYSDSDTSCTGSTVSQVTIAAGGSTASYRYKPASTGTTYVRARDSASVLTMGVIKMAIQ